MTRGVHVVPPSKPLPPVPAVNQNLNVRSGPAESSISSGAFKVRAAARELVHYELRTGHGPSLQRALDLLWASGPVDEASRPVEERTRCVRCGSPEDGPFSLYRQHCTACSYAVREDDWGDVIDTARAEYDRTRGGVGGPVDSRPVGGCDEEGER